MINFDFFGKPYFNEVLPLRIPYMGSKRKICNELFQKMLEIKPNAKYFFDLFGGGGSMSFFALQIGLKTHYNEKQKGLVDLINYILDRSKNKQSGKFGIFPDDFYKFITREEFAVLKDEDSIKGQFARICYSFGNNQKSYLFGDIEELKRLAHDIVVFRNENALAEFNQKNNSNFVLSDKKTWNERRLDFMAQIPRASKIEQLQRLERLEQLQQLEQLERLEQLEQLQQLQQLLQLERLERLERLPAFSISNLDFQEVKIETPVAETIIYLDPPYRGTYGYLEGVLHSEIDSYFLNSPYSCFMSEYNAPFDSVLEIKKESLLNNTKAEKKVVIEKLFYNKK
jgi:site-specific DNA-adenine methylase